MAMMTSTTERKRKFSKGEALAILKKHNCNFRVAAEELCETLLGHTLDDESTIALQDLEDVIGKYRKNLQVLEAKDRRRDFRHEGAAIALEETIAECGDHDAFPSQEDQASSDDAVPEDFLSQKMDELWHSTQGLRIRGPYKSITEVSSVVRNERAKPMLESRRRWAHEQGCTPSSVVRTAHPP